MSTTVDLVIFKILNFKMFLFSCQVSFFFLYFKKTFINTKNIYGNQGVITGILVVIS